MGYKIMSDTHL